MTERDILLSCITEADDVQTGLEAFELIIKDGLMTAVLSHDVSKEPRDEAGKWMKQARAASRKAMKASKDAHAASGDTDDDIPYLKSKRAFKLANTAHAHSNKEEPGSKWASLHTGAATEHYEAATLHEHIHTGIVSHSSYSAKDIFAQDLVDSHKRAEKSNRKAEALHWAAYRTIAKARKALKSLGVNVKFAHDVSSEPRDEHGEWTTGGSTTAKKPKSAKKASTSKRTATAKQPRKPRAKPEKLQARAKRIVAGKLEKVEGRAFDGKPKKAKQKLSKQMAGAIGEAIVIEYSKQRGFADAQPFSDFMQADDNNLPVDSIRDYEGLEIKTGQVSNGKSAQQWRLTIGEPGEQEKKFLASATKEQKAEHNKFKIEQIRKRKEQALGEAGKKLGKPVKIKTVTVILDHDAKKADLYEFEGIHERIDWNSAEAKEGYVGTVRYGGSQEGDAKLSIDVHGREHRDSGPGGGQFVGHEEAALSRREKRDLRRAKRDAKRVVYLIKSRIAHVVPNVGPLHHKSVAICPKGEPPILPDGTSNPKCKLRGTQYGHSTFLDEDVRHGAEAVETKATASAVRRAMRKFKKSWTLMSNNCKDAADEVVRAAEALAAGDSGPMSKLIYRKVRRKGDAELSIDSNATVRWELRGVGHAR